MLCIEMVKIEPENTPIKVSITRTRAWELTGATSPVNASMGGLLPTRTEERSGAINSVRIGALKHHYETSQVAGSPGKSL